MHKLCKPSDVDKAAVTGPGLLPERRGVRRFGSSLLTLEEHCSFLRRFGTRASCGAPVSRSPRFAEPRFAEPPFRGAPARQWPPGRSRRQQRNHLRLCRGAGALPTAGLLGLEQQGSVSCCKGAAGKLETPAAPSRREVGERLLVAIRLGVKTVCFA